jgi:hypothetical protein
MEIKLTRRQARLCLVRMFHDAILEYRALKKRKKLNQKQKKTFREINSFLFGRKNALNVLRLLIDVDDFNKIINGIKGDGNV